jgi:hypothetical protein
VNCAVCIWELVPLNHAMQGMYRLPDGTHAAISPHNIETLITQEAEMKTVDGRILPVNAITSYDGTYLCAVHLPEYVHAILQATGRRL